VGLSFYTLGQRQGLGIGGVKAKGAQLKALQAQGLRGAGEHEPWFVARKDMANNTLWVVQGHDHPWLLAHRLHAQDLQLGRRPGAAPGPAMAAKTRYRQQDATCTVIGADAQQCELSFAHPQWAVTPGQSAVLYDGEVCLGGGVIDACDALTPEAFQSLQAA
jgi:tRNA-uridine 2-sulfurtransferase